MTPCYDERRSGRSSELNSYPVGLRRARRISLLFVSRFAGRVRPASSAALLRFSTESTRIVHVQGGADRGGHRLEGSGRKACAPLPLAQQGCAEFVNNASDLFCALPGTFATVENCPPLPCKMERPSRKSRRTRSSNRRLGAGNSVRGSQPAIFPACRCRRPQTRGGPMVRCNVSAASRRMPCAAQVGPRSAVLRCRQKLLL
jgi:hypothetical protein